MQDSPKVKTGTAWYGRLVGDTAELQPKNPIDIVPMLKAPVLGLYGGQDPGIPLDTVEEMRAALKKAGNPSEIIVYPDAPHGFFCRHPSELSQGSRRRWLEKAACLVQEIRRSMMNDELRMTNYELKHTSL